MNKAFNQKYLPLIENVFLTNLQCEKMIVSEDEKWKVKVLKGENQGYNYQLDLVKEVMDDIMELDKKYVALEKERFLKALKAYIVLTVDVKEKILI